MLFEEGVFFRICIANYIAYNLNVTFSGLMTSVGKDRAVFLKFITRNFVVSKEAFPLPLHVILLWHSLDIPYDYFTVRNCSLLCKGVVAKKQGAGHVNFHVASWGLPLTLTSQ